jgi:hypothetical protein
MTSRPTPLVVLDVVGLTPPLLAAMPRLRASVDAGFAARITATGVKGPASPDMLS